MAQQCARESWRDDGDPGDRAGRRRRNRLPGDAVNRLTIPSRDGKKIGTLRGLDAWRRVGDARQCGLRTAARRHRPRRARTRQQAARRGDVQPLRGGGEPAARGAEPTVGRGAGRPHRPARLQRRAAALGRAADPDAEPRRAGEHRPARVDRAARRGDGGPAGAAGAPAVAHAAVAVGRQLRDQPGLGGAAPRLPPRLAVALPVALAARLLRQPGRRVLSFPPGRRRQGLQLARRACRARRRLRGRHRGPRRRRRARARVALPAHRLGDRRPGAVRPARCRTPRRREAGRAVGPPSRRRCPTAADGGPPRARLTA